MPTCSCCERATGTARGTAMACFAGDVAAGPCVARSSIQQSQPARGSLCTPCASVVFVSGVFWPAGGEPGSGRSANCCRPIGLWWVHLLFITLGWLLFSGRLQSLQGYSPGARVRKLDRYISTTVLTAMTLVLLVIGGLDLLFTVIEELGDVDENYRAVSAMRFVSTQLQAVSMNCCR